MIKIILEGPDNSGKTTLANILVREVRGLNYHHPGGRPADHEAELQCIRNQMELMTKGPSVLMDRCTPISQQVYSPDPAKDEVRADALTALIAEGVLFVYCRPSTDWLMSFENFTWREGETEEFKQEIISKQHLFIERYDELMRVVPHVHYDYKSDEAVNLIKHIALAAKGNETSLSIIQALKTYVVPHARDSR